MPPAAPSWRTAMPTVGVGAMPMSSTVQPAASQPGEDGVPEHLARSAGCRGETTTRPPARYVPKAAANRPAASGVRPLADDPADAGDGDDQVRTRLGRAHPGSVNDEGAKPRVAPSFGPNGPRSGPRSTLRVERPHPRSAEVRRFPDSLPITLAPPRSGGARIRRGASNEGPEGPKKRPKPGVAPSFGPYHIVEAAGFWRILLSELA